MLYFTGFADEVSGDIDVQIKATQELDWNFIEARNIEGENLTDISDKKFEEVYRKLTESGVNISCFGSKVANWGKSPYKEEDYEQSIEELKRAIPRMKKLGTKMIRGMSFFIPKNEYPNNPELEKSIIKKLKVLVNMCEQEDIIYLHENCMNYFSQSYEHMERLIKSMDSPYFKVVFDTGNPVFTDNRIGDPPYKKQNTWEVYQILKHKIHYIHIKDGIFIKDTENYFPEVDYTFPGEGNGQVKKVLKDLIANGYKGGISIEPHMGQVYHTESYNNNDKSLDEYKFNTYIEYGKKTMKMVENIRKSIMNEEKNVNE
ncbi:MAG TPA: sugar phosphate isomerase/epimerase family protein [Atribacterota bacterium]|nr:sugar phosphate isomerase/epimerase family protein [Atribacterota bacterium]